MKKLMMAAAGAAETIPADESAKHGAAIAEKRTDWAGSSWSEQFDKRVEAVRGKTLDFVIFGDSITMCWTYPAADKYSGGKEVWEKHFGNLKTLNLGVSGDRTEHLLWRVTKQGEADGWKAKVIFVQIGSNNRFQTRAGWDRCDTPEETVLGTKAILEAVKTRHPESRIILLGCLPWGHGTNDWQVKYNQLSAKLAGGNVEFRDFSGLFVDAEGKLKKELFRDGVHPFPAGYEVYAQQLDALLKEASK